MMDILKERWAQYVALTTTVFAVCAAISSLKGSSYSTRVQVITTRESSAWAYYQAKSIKQHVTESERDAFALRALEIKTGPASKWLSGRIRKIETDLSRYEKEKAEIKAQADGYNAEAEKLKRHSAQFGMAVMLLQIAIMLNSVGALIKKPWMWIGGMAFGISGLVYMASGFLL
jgi:hypothetical protein